MRSHGCLDSFKQIPLPLPSVKATHVFQVCQPLKSACFKWKGTRLKVTPEPLISATKVEILTFLDHLDARQISHMKLLVCLETHLSDGQA